MTDLLALRDHEPPMGDTAGHQPFAFGRALWTERLPGEAGAPARRIIHARAVPLHAPARLHRLGLRTAPGHHKCGSHVDLDRVTAFRVLVWDGTAWRVHRDERDLPAATDAAPAWYDLGSIEARAALIEIRRCAIDGWWPSWNLAAGGLMLEGELLEPLAPPGEQLLQPAPARTTTPLPAGLSSERTDGALRFRSAHFDVAFCLNRAGLARLAPGAPERRADVLRHNPGLFFQGPQLHPVGSAPVVQPALRNHVTGTTTVDGNRVVYELTLGTSGQHYRLAWEVWPDRLVLEAERHGERPLRAWRSCAWMLGLDCTVTPAHAIGRLVRSGETGLLDLPAWLHFPGHGSFLLEASGDEVLLRSDAFRPLDMTTLELKLGEVPRPEGDYLLPAGRFHSRLTWHFSDAFPVRDTAGTGDEPGLPLRDDAPAEVVRAIRRCTLTAFTFRPDTATLSNNGASIHCPICMDNWSAIARRAGSLLPGFPAMELVRYSLERWLDGGPGYTSGYLGYAGHAAEDEYLMTGAACLLGLADFLEAAGTPAWVACYREPIRQQLDAMRARDLDGDGLVESPYRTGVSGTGQWSTCWFDVVSFGWKDAFTNALLYPALVRLAGLLPRLGAAEEAEGLEAWAARLRAHFAPAFYNEATGWLAGWRCREDRLHDYAFLPPNGAAVCAGLLDDDLARDVIRRLWKEARRRNLPDAYLGLPGNLWPIPDDDLAGIMHGYPFGFYQNGGRTHAQSRHFVGALYRVGMRQEAETLLRRLCAGLADAAVFGGCRSGRDWRYWDDRPCGYEGLLTDQFGILAVALDVFGRDFAPSPDPGR
ncbi:hypothetical protein GQ464_017295 [Rhodocaloribacter litoris]|uniref:hypothetical protein n=1 Tax=Rhodocaloribacter litoris TaxID=2558931 RepID=UPI00141F1638|nr:hypothetical protein [Rhodocaloribacter litoris]QXD15138.1 hypothetical protein GQ464_017295 [Rhodocaloribacter litoris]